VTAVERAAAPPVDAVRLSALRRRTMAVLIAGQILGGLGVATGIALAAVLARQVSGTEALSGLAPTATCPGVTTAKVQYAPRSCSSRARNQVRAAVAASVSTPAVKSRRITKFAPSPSPISSAITRRTICA